MASTLFSKPIVSKIPTATLAKNTTYLKTIATKQSKFYSSKILNYVEPVNIGSFIKTAFWSEINTNFNYGDTVFIINGNYDSNTLVLADKYAPNTTGYKVLGVDGCKVILDIDYTGVLPFEDINIEEYIKVNHISSQREFDYINSIVTPINVSPYEGMHSKFFGNIPYGSLTASLYTNDIVFSSGTFSGNTSYGGLGVGFWVRDDSTSPAKTWVNITSQFLNNSLSTVNGNYTNNGRIYIVGEDFTYGGVDYKQRLVYEELNNKWVIDPIYKQPIISKLNFRYGTFKGTHNDGLFGSEDKTATWNDATWNSGIATNVNWKAGSMASKSNTGDRSYYARLQNGKPVQSSDVSNNSGYGYNFIMDSDIKSGTFLNGLFDNCNIGVSSTFSALDSYFGITQSSTVTIKKGQYTLCNITDSNLLNGLFTNVNISNTNISNSKLVNSQLNKSTVDNSDYNSDSGIQVIGADLWSYDSNPGVYSPSTSTTIRGILKLYVSAKDLYKLEIGDSFYITKINKNYVLSSLTNDQKVFLPIETRYTLDSYFDSNLSTNSINVSLKTKMDNIWKSYVTGTTTTDNTLVANDQIFDSIDIDCSDFGYYYDLSGNVVYTSNLLSPISLTNVNKLFSNIYLYDSDFRSGIFNRSNWVSGGNLNYQQNQIKNITSDVLDIELYVASPDSFVVKLNYNPMNSVYSVSDFDSLDGDYVWLNNISYVNGTYSVSLDGRYKVNGVTYFTGTPPYWVSLRLFPQDNTSVIMGVTSSTGGVYQVVGAENNTYASIDKFIINNSTISSGLFKKTGIVNSTISSNEFDNTDTNLVVSNNNILRFINTIFSTNNNTINDGVIYKSHIVEATWNNGVLFNSVWNGPLFGNGVVKSSYWLNGTFNSGKFYDSGLTSSTVVDYDSIPRYQSWLNGTFSIGEFYNSVWLNGRFNNGRFYKSTWYGGVWNNGVLGSNNLSLSDTTFGKLAPLPYSATVSYWNNGIVENALVGGDGLVYWYGGKFNKGEFTSNGTSSTNQSIWYGGDFNGGKFTNLARWKSGNFFNGKFISTYGYNNVSPTNSSTYSTDYGWESGSFYGGVFGNADTATNSVWYSGDFNGGIFQGRFWNSGLFYNGTFLGSGQVSATPSSVSSQGEFDFANSFTSSYYGLWNSGFVSDKKYEVKTSQRVFTQLVRKVEEKKIDISVNMSNVLWMDGVFNHNYGTIQDSLFIGGTFSSGNFTRGIFNPYIDQNFTGSFSRSSFNTQSCVWTGGIFASGSFYYSEWQNGIFQDGYMAGAIWDNGLWNYGYADNIYWKSGRWRNGNWNGSPYGSTLISTYSTPNTMNRGREKDLILNISNALGTSSIHLINVFSASVTPIDILSDKPVGSLGSTGSWTYSQETYYGVLYYSGSPLHPTPHYGYLAYSGWGIGNTFSYTTATTSTSITVGIITDSNAYTRGGTFAASDPSLPSPISTGSTLGYNSTTLPSLNMPASSKLYAVTNPGSGPTTSVFVDTATTYTVNLQVTVELTPTVSIEVGYGGNIQTFTLSSDYWGWNAGTSMSPIRYRYYYPKLYNLTFTVNTTDDSLASSGGQQFYIRKTSDGIMRLLRGEIKERLTEYHDTYNNTLYNGIVGSTVSLPNDPHLSLTAGASDGNVVSIAYGNGVFQSGIWENGVWNNGYRASDWFGSNDTLRFSDVNQGMTYQTDTSTAWKKNWIITLISLDTMDGLSVGDKVSIGNIVGININGSRVLIKDYYTIVGINNTVSTDMPNGYLKVSLTTNFPLRQIVRDSTNHLIYVTKNIWLSGAFLNGYFRGVWNTGLFQGYPNITEMQNTHWIDGKFSGGHYISNNIPASLTLQSYNTGVIQNFTFIDKNIANPYKFLYESWIDVNYTTDSQSNLYQDTSFWDSGVTNVYEINGVSSKPNLNGLITYDVLSSLSTFRNGYDFNSKDYNLGVKWTKYDNFLPEGSFNNLFSKSIPSLGLDNFYNDGWDIQSWAQGSTGVSVLDLGIYGSWSLYPEDFVLENTDNTLKYISSTHAEVYSTGGATAWPSSAIQTYTVLKNSNTSNIPVKRYSMMEYNLISFQGFTGPDPVSGGYNHARSVHNSAGFYPPAINTLSFPATWSISQLVANPVYSSDPIKREYFYNKHSLTMMFVGGGISTSPADYYPLTIQMDNLSFYEVDMIPFFQYFVAYDEDANTSLAIDMAIKTPYAAVAPYIDYGSGAFSFIGTVDIVIDSSGVVSSGAGSVGGGSSPGTTTTTWATYLYAPTF
jgi:hypothetical protein